jgi:hypothetical protein
MRTALVNARVLTDAGIENGITVVIDGERIAEVSASRVEAEHTHDLQGRVLASHRRIAASAPPACCRH